MATYDRTWGQGSLMNHGTPESGRLQRRTGLDWGAIFGGTVVGWGLLFLLSLIGAAIGFAAIDPYAARPGENGSIASGVWGALAMIAASMLGGFLVVRLAGDRRRGESLLHGAVSWGLSMIAGGMLAMTAASAASSGAAQAARDTRPRTTRLTQTDRARIDEGSSAAARLAGLSAGGAALALVGALFGALLAASRRSGVPLSAEFRMPVAHKHARLQQPPMHAEHDESRDRTTIIPPH